MFLSLFQYGQKHVGEFIPLGNQGVCNEWCRGGFSVLHSPRLHRHSSESNCYSPWMPAKDCGDKGPGDELFIFEFRGDLNNEA